MFSLDGNYLYAGEGTCKNPAINVWDVTAAGRIVVSPLRQLKGHKVIIELLIIKVLHIATRAQLVHVWLPGVGGLPT